MTGQTVSNRSLRRHAATGLAVIVLLVGGFGGWAASTEIAGAVVAPGTLVVDSNVKKVQHPTGGVIRTLLVRDGVPVKAGDLLVQLDDTVARANLAIIRKSLDELSARRARLETERDDLDSLVFPDGLLARVDDPEVSRTLSSERKLFAFRTEARRGQKAQLREQIGQLDEEVRGFVGQEQAKQKELGIIDRELEGVRLLWEKKLVPISRLTALERDATRVDGERNQLVANMARARGKRAEIELQIIQIDQDMRSEVAKELRDIEAKTAEQVERKVAAEDQLQRIDIRAPQDGTILQMAVHTIGGVVNAGETLMLVVPAADRLTVEVKIAPQSIDQLQIGQTAVLRFSAFDMRTTPEILGQVTVVSADIGHDDKTGAPFYVVRIEVPAEQIARLKGLKLVPGMPVEAFIQSSERTVVSYFVKPLRDQIARAFRER
ncbi:HlyD family type I secretion periplasmic adaptor subunit [Reyranella sp.]|uniref:HlyD family type I secretion periplasmic adaptor subunit n=1 Tax=Reyranella sp. TaxID=1929291 RepID=UPI003BA91B25